MELLSLPEELLSLVVDQLVVVAERRKIAEALRSLRCVCRRFAYNHTLQSQLFHGINLVCEPTHFARISTGDISHVAPFVRHVNFVPPLHLPMLHYSNFRFMVESAVGNGVGCYRDAKHPRRSSRLSKTGLDRLSISSFFVPFMHNERTIKASYKTYEKNAFDSLSLVYTGDEGLQRHWIRILRSLPNCHSFRFALVDYCELDQELKPAYPDCITRPIGEKRNELHCEIEDAAYVANKFVAMAIEVLAASQVTIHRLVFNQPTIHDTYTWDDILPWTMLDMSHVQSLVFEPCLPEYNEGWAFENSSVNVMEDAVFLLSQCKETLEDFDCRRATCISWGEMEPVALPRLKTLLLTGDTTSHHLAQWIALCPNLEKIALESMQLTDDSDMSWRIVFDAMRDHPVLSDIKLNMWLQSDFIDCEFDKARARIGSEFACDVDDRSVAEHAIALYISGRAGWTVGLTDFFADEFSDDSE